MEDNTRMKELQADTKRNAEVIEKGREEMTALMNHSDAANATRFTRWEATTIANEAKLNQISESIEALLRRQTLILESYNGESNFHKQPFQV